jgi:hypothetical protein
MRMRSNPQMYVDPDGRNTIVVGGAAGGAVAGPAGAAIGAGIGAAVAIGAFICYRAFGGGGGGGDDDDDDDDRCKKVKEKCIDICSDIALGGGGYDGGTHFQRCINQCMFDNDCGGNDYGPRGWSGDNPGATTPWR